MIGANLAFGKQTVPDGALVASGGYFPVLGVKPLLGRTISPEDDVDGAGNAVAVLGYGYWHDKAGRRDQRAEPAHPHQRAGIHGGRGGAQGVHWHHAGGLGGGLRSPVFHGMADAQLDRRRPLVRLLVIAGRAHQARGRPGTGCRGAQWPVRRPAGAPVQGVAILLPEAA